MENVFKEKLLKPDEQKISETLNLSYKLWHEIKNFVHNNFEFISEEWKFYGNKIGWTLKTFHKKRNIFFFSAYENCFGISFVFGEKTVNQIQNENFPKELIDELLNVKKFAEGRGILIIVKNKNDVENIQKLIQIKLQN